MTNRGQREQAEPEAPQAEPDVVQEDEDEGRQQEDYGLQGGGHRAGELLAQGLEHGDAHHEVAGREAFEEPPRQAEQAVPRRGPDAGRDAPLDAHQRRALPHLQEDGGDGQHDQGRRDLHQHAAGGGGNHHVREQARRDGRGQQG